MKAWESNNKRGYDSCGTAEGILSSLIMTNQMLYWLL